MLIGGDDISNDVTTLGTCLNMFDVFTCLISGNLTTQLTASHREIRDETQIPET